MSGKISALRHCGGSLGSVCAAVPAGMEKDLDNRMKSYYNAETVRFHTKEADGMEHRANPARRFYQLFCETDVVYRETAAKLGLTHSIFEILYAVWNCGEGTRCPLREVCRRSGLGKQTVNSALRRMEAEGLAYVERAGGRHKDVCLTAAGGALAERTVARIMEAENAVFASWTVQEVESYLSLTEKYLTAFREEAGRLKGS